MDVIKTLQGITFEWDSHKAVTNLNKHGVSFEHACEVFFDPFLIVLKDDEFIDGEIREMVIGVTRGWRLLFIVYVMRVDRIRLISARLTTNMERKQYENG